MKRQVTMGLLLAGLLVACGMISSWKAIPPPGGCESCHQQQISADWKVAYAPATLTDETGKLPWQKPEAMLPPAVSPLEEKKVTEERCFRCHKGPDKAHVEYKGRYHH